MSIYNQLQKRKKITKREVDLFMNQVTTTQNGSGFSNGFMVKQYFEDMGVKQKTLSELEGLVNKDTIIASNTSSLQISIS